MPFSVTEFMEKEEPGPVSGFDLSSFLTGPDYTQKADERGAPASVSWDLTGMTLPAHEPFDISEFLSQPSSELARTAPSGPLAPSSTMVKPFVPPRPDMLSVGPGIDYRDKIGASPEDPWAQDWVKQEAEKPTSIGANVRNLARDVLSVGEAIKAQLQHVDALQNPATRIGGLKELGMDVVGIVDFVVQSIYNAGTAIGTNPFAGGLNPVKEHAAVWFDQYLSSESAAEKHAEIDKRYPAYAEARDQVDKHLFGTLLGVFGVVAPFKRAMVPKPIDVVKQARAGEVRPVETLSRVGEELPTEGPAARPVKQIVQTEPEVAAPRMSLDAAIAKIEDIVEQKTSPEFLEKVREAFYEKNPYADVESGPLYLQHLEKTVKEFYATGHFKTFGQRPISPVRPPEPGVAAPPTTGAGGAISQRLQEPPVRPETIPGLIKTVTKEITDEQWSQITSKYNRGNLQSAIGSAALSAKKSGAARYVAPTANGFTIYKIEPASLVNYWKVTVDGNTVTGNLIDGMMRQRTLRAAEPLARPETPTGGIVRSPYEETGPLGSESYIQAKKQVGGKWKLFYLGTNNEIFPGELFNSATEARTFFRVQKIKRAQAASTSPPTTAGKQAWEMTRDEYRKTRPDNVPDDHHYRLIKSYLWEGKPVPSKVLADYPDLAAKYGKPPSAGPMEAGSEPLKPPVAPKIISALDKLEAEARARITQRNKDAGTTMFDIGGATGEAAKMVADYAIIGAAKIARGTVEFAGWSADMVREFGDAVKPHLKAIYAQAKDHLNRYDESLRAVSDEKIAAGKGEVVGLSQAEISRYRQGMGFDALDQAKRQRLQTTMELARQEGADHAALDNADAILRAHSEGVSVPALSNTEQIGMNMKRIDFDREYTQALKEGKDARARGDVKGAEAAAERADQARQNVENLTSALIRARTAAGRGLQVGNVMLETESLPAALAEYEVRNGRPAPPEVKARIKKLHGELERVKEENRKLTEQEDQRVAERASQIAEAVTKREVARTRIKGQATGTRAQNEVIRQDAYKKLEAMGMKLASGVNPEALYQIGRIAVSHIKDGATSLGEVVRLVKEKIPGITEQDIYEALGTKDPKTQARVAVEAPKRLARLKTEARLLTDINNAINGIFKEPKPSPAQFPQIKALQIRLSNLRAGAYESIASGAQLEKAVQRINELQDMLDNHYRAIKKRQPILPEDLAAMRDKAGDIQKRMKVEDEMIDLQEQMRTKDFKTPPQQTRGYISPELERSQIQLQKVRQQYRFVIDERGPKTLGQKVGSGVKEAINIAREIKATGDVSYTLRQNVVAALSHPVKTAKVFGPSIKGMFDQYRAEQIQNSLEHRSTAYLSDKAGLKLNELEHVAGPHEEMFSSRLLDKIPVVREITRASNRHMTLMGNLVRTGLFDDFIHKNPNATTVEMQAYARWLNVSTGIGELGQLGKAGQVLSTVFFAPKLAVSRFQTPYLFAKALAGKDGPRVRAQVARDFVGAAITAAVILETARLAGAKVGIDPREADFGKIRIGDTRFDIGGGFLQPLRLVLRLGEWGVTDPAGITGRDLLPREKDIDPIELLTRFASYKMSPALSLTLELRTGKTIIGQPTTIPQSLADAVTPLLVSDIIEAWKQESLKRAAFVGTLSAFGVGSSTYPAGETATRKEIRLLLDEGKITEAREKKRQWNIRNPKNRIVTQENTRDGWIGYINKLREDGKKIEAEQARQDWNRRHPNQLIGER